MNNFLNATQNNSSEKPRSTLNPQFSPLREEN